jgi:isopenicillin N synthase-like dioxygenase
MPPAGALPGWAEVVEEYYVAVRALASALLPAYARALKAEASYFEGKFDQPCWCIRINHYPPPSDPTAAAVGIPPIIPPHADGDFATFVLTDDQPGLSLLRADGETWVHLRE